MCRVVSNKSANLFEFVSFVELGMYHVMYLFFCFVFACDVNHFSFALFLTLNKIYNVTTALTDFLHNHM